MSSAAGADNLPRSEIMEEINACVVDICGGCPESGGFILHNLLCHINHAKRQGSLKNEEYFNEKTYNDA